jgi:hypothetical protein
MMSPVLPCAGWNWLRAVPGSDEASRYPKPCPTFRVYQLEPINSVEPLQNKLFYARLSVK